jgi:nicotinate phosphoribosyltransferase
MREATESVLLTDLYQLTMLQAYWQHRMDGIAVFELFVRQLPAQRAFLVAAGLEQAVQFVQQARFDANELDWIATSGRFAPGFAGWLSELRFTGDIWAMPEGTVFFADEPILRVTAPIAQAQWLESRLLNLVHFETVVASKAARAVLAAQVHDLIDFGLRRAHGAEAGLLAARASYLAGFAGTATALAGPRFGIPVFGTMAHSFVQAHDDEAAAFVQFAQSFPGDAVLLLDTYDTVAAARCVAHLAPGLARRGIQIKAVRLDSGDLAELSSQVRAVLDQAGLRHVTILASGSLDEYRIEALRQAQAPIDSYGIGSSVATSSDEPCLDAVYKLQEYAGVPRRKRSAGKSTRPGRKQVWRRRDRDGCFSGDLVGLEDEPQGEEALLQPVVLAGVRTGSPPSLAQVRNHCRDQLGSLPPPLRSLRPPWPPYPVEISARVQALAAAADRRHPANCGLFAGRCL